MSVTRTAMCGICASQTVYLVPAAAGFIALRLLSFKFFLMIAVGMVFSPFG